MHITKDIVTSLYSFPVSVWTQMIKIDAIHTVLSLLVAPEVVGNNDREPGRLSRDWLCNDIYCD